MLKKIAVAVGATALAGTGLALASPSAHAAPAHPAGSIYLHGTTHLAHFWSRTDCEAHAKYEVGLVLKASATQTLLPAVQRANDEGPELRFTCYPLRNGQWSYLTAYMSKTGKPIQSADLYLDTTNRAAQVQAGTSIDTQDVWPFAHVVTHNAATTKTSTCNAQRNYIVNEIKKSLSLRLIGADKVCTVANGQVSYEADYASTGPSGLPYDHVSPSAAELQPILDVLGYKYPGAPTYNTVSSHHMLAWK